jgi:hypothetical protein
LIKGKLILVAGHAIPRRFDRLESDEGWHLKHFQSGEGSCYVEHVRAGVKLAAESPESLLLFAGGQTDAAAGPMSEGQGYWAIAEHSEWFGTPEVRGRASTEEFSMDSFLNLLYGLCRYREMTGAYPERTVAVGWGFKGPRFDLHRAALRYPANRFRYFGVNDPPRLAENIHFEALRREGFREDPYGAQPDFVSKRMARNVFHRQHGYAISCPEIRGLLDYTGPEIYPGPLPWDE